MSPLNAEMARISRLAERELGDLEDPDFDFEIGPVGIDYSSEKMWYLVSCLSWEGDDELGGDWYYAHHLRQLWCKDPRAKEDKQGWLKWNIKNLEAFKQNIMANPTAEITYACPRAKVAMYLYLEWLPQGWRSK